MSKGSKRRPCLVPREQFEKNWDECFRNQLHRNEMQRIREELEDVGKYNKLLKPGKIVWRAK